MDEAPDCWESWMPAMETEEAPACQRMDLPGAKSPMRWRAWVAVIQVLVGRVSIWICSCLNFKENEGTNLGDSGRFFPA